MTMERLLATALPLAALAFAAGPFFTNFNGFEPSLYPVPQINPPAQPAGYAFAIWGVIYLALIGATFWGWYRHSGDPAWRPHRAPLLISLIIGVTWLPVAEVSPIWALVLIWVMLLTALMALARAPESATWSLRLAVGLYAGWLTAASAVSIALVGAGWGLVFGEAAWAIIAVGVAVAVAALTIFALSDAPAYPAAVIWGLVGIVAQNLGTNTAIAASSAIAALVVLAFSLSVRRVSGNT